MDADILRALITAVELKDQTTAAHTWRVALYTMSFVELLGVEPDDVARYLHAAVLHDIGKIDVPQSILAKAGPLTRAEYDLMKTHTTLGYERLVRMGETDQIVLDLVRHHHERLDGSGYPDGLSGADIPMAARFFAVIDSFDAMTSVRPYRPELQPSAVESALAELEEKAGLWYCPHAVRLFADLYRKGSLSVIMRHFGDADSLEGLDVLPDSRQLQDERSRLVEEPPIVTTPGAPIPGPQGRRRRSTS